MDSRWTEPFRKMNWLERLCLLPIVLGFALFGSFAFGMDTWVRSGSESVIFGILMLGCIGGWLGATVTYWLTQSVFDRKLDAIHARKLASKVVALRRAGASVKDIAQELRTETDVVWRIVDPLYEDPERAIDEFLVMRPPLEQRQVVELALAEVSDEEIAQRLGICESVVWRHIEVHNHRREQHRQEMEACNARLGALVARQAGA